MDKKRQILKKMQELGPVVPGSLEEVYKTCGDKYCSCKKGKEYRHGPYYSIKWYKDGKEVRKRVAKELVKEVRSAIARRKKADTLYRKWLEESLEGFLS